MGMFAILCQRICLELFRVRNLGDAPEWNTSRSGINHGIIPPPPIVAPFCVSAILATPMYRPRQLQAWPSDIDICVRMLYNSWRNYNTDLDYKPGQAILAFTCECSLALGDIITPTSTPSLAKLY